MLHVAPMFHSADLLGTRSPLSAPRTRTCRSLRRLTYGSAPMDTVWVRRTMEAFPGVELVHSYGLTETSPILTTLGWKHHLAGRRLTSVGSPVDRPDETAAVLRGGWFFTGMSDDWMRTASFTYWTAGRT